MRTMYHFFCCLFLNFLLLTFNLNALIFHEGRKQDKNPPDSCQILPQIDDISQTEGSLPLFYWKEGDFINFGDYISLVLVERIVGEPLKFYNKKNLKQNKKLLAIGSVIYFANENDVIWGSGINAKIVDKNKFSFTHLDIRAVRGPLTRAFLIENFGLKCPEIYGDPALLFPYFFPEFKKKKTPSYDYIVISHYLDAKYFKDNSKDNIILATEPWELVLKKILASKFVISSSLHGLILAEAYGIPARMLRLSETEPLFKYKDYYIATGRPHFEYATSVEEALRMGGEPKFKCDLKKLYNAFPFEFWPNRQFLQPNFTGENKK